MKRRLWTNKWTNQLQSLLLVFCMGLLMVAIGWLLFGQLGVLLAIGIAAYNLLFGPAISPRAVLRAYHAQPITTYEAPELLQLFSRLLERTNLAHPVQLWYVPSQVPNAFAVGSGSNASIAVTDGLLRLMNQRELAGVLAHELAHVRHQDTTVMGIADTMGRIATSIARLGALTILLGLPTLLFGNGLGSTFAAGLLMMGAPLAVFLLQMALSRTREFNADLGAVEITGDPPGLAAALEKLERVSQGGWLSQVLKPGQNRIDPSWIRSHPATKDRVRQLQEVANSSTTEPVSRAAAGFSSASDRSALLEAKIPIDFHEPVLARPRYHVREGVWY